MKAETRNSVQEEMHEALSAIFAGVSDTRRRALDDVGNSDQQIWMTPVLVGALRKVRDALARAEAAR